MSTHTINIRTLISAHTDTIHIQTVQRPNLARQDLSKEGEGVKKGHAVNCLVQILNEQVSDASVPQPRIPLGPHYAHGLSHKALKVEHFQCSLS